MSADLLPIAKRLRAMHAQILPLGFSSAKTGAEVFHVCADRAEFLVLLRAAELLEQGWVIQSENQDVSEIQAEAAAGVLERVREAARAEIASYQHGTEHDQRVAAQAITGMLRRLGVEP